MGLMKLRALIYLGVGALVVASCADTAPPSSTPPDADGALPSRNVVDLTHAFNDETIYWPTEAGFRRTVTAEGTTDRGYFYAAGSFTSAEHGGTHLDAPYHFVEDAHTVDEIPLDHLMGPAVVIDVPDHAAANPDYQITTEDLRSWENENGPVPDGSIVLFRTGFGQFWPDRARYMGTDSTGSDAVVHLHFPGLHPDAAAWLLENRSIKAVGIDTPSIDYGQSQLFATHRQLFDENVPAFENVAHLDSLPEVGAVVIALPMKIDGGTGAPLRIVAFVP